LACARHTAGSCATKRRARKSREAQEGNLDVVEAISVIRCLEAVSNPYIKVRGDRKKRRYSKQSKKGGEFRTGTKYQRSEAVVAMQTMPRM
jgi:hypothetical protein